MNLSDTKAHAMGLLFGPDSPTRPVIYTPYNGAPVEVSAGIVYGEYQPAKSFIGDGSTTWRLTIKRDMRADFRSGVVRSLATIFVSAADIPMPESRDTIEIDGVRWSVTEVQDA